MVCEDVLLCILRSSSMSFVPLNHFCSVSYSLFLMITASYFNQESPVFEKDLTRKSSNNLFLYDSITKQSSRKTLMDIEFVSVKLIIDKLIKCNNIMEGENLFADCFCWEFGKNFEQIVCIFWVWRLFMPMNWVVICYLAVSWSEPEKLLICFYCWKLTFVI